MSRRFILLCLCAVAAMNAFAFNSLYLGAGATYLNVKPAKHASTYTGTAASLYLGYGGWMDEYWYLALEAWAILDPHNAGSNHGFINPKPRYHYGLGFIPAINLDNTVLLYLRIGAVRASFENVNVAKNTWQAGIGLEVPILCNWSVRGEYDYAPFAGIDDIGTVKSNQASLSVLYRFDPILPDAYGLLS